MAKILRRVGTRRMKYEFLMSVHSLTLGAPNDVPRGGL
jgi:hypothetical protein